MNADEQATFEDIRARKRNYALTFGNSPYSQLVLQDLAEFCRATETVYHEDERLTYVLIGRNEVWKRIQDLLNLTAQDLYRLRTGQQLNFKDEEQ